jgi:hypothetical protein
MKIKTNPKIGAQEREKIVDELLEARPTQGLITTLSKFAESAALKDALNALAPLKRMPKDVRDFLLKHEEKNGKCVAFLRVIFAQAERRFSPVSDDPRHIETLGFKGREDFDAFNKIVALNKPKGGLKSARGKIDPTYDWFRKGDHELPQLASALGITPEGLQKRCRRLKINIKQPAVAKRARKVRSHHARKLLLVQIELPVNEGCDMARKVLQWNGLSTETSFGTGIFSPSSSASR